MNRWSLKMWALLFMTVTASGLSAQPPVPSKKAGVGANPADAIAEYINPFHRGDYRQVLDSLYDTKERIARIQAENPKILWDKLIEEMYTPQIISIQKAIRFQSDKNRRIMADRGNATPQGVLTLDW